MKLNDKDIEIEKLLRRKDNTSSSDEICRRIIADEMAPHVRRIENNERTSKEALEKEVQIENHLKDLDFKTLPMLQEKIQSLANIPRSNNLGSGERVGKIERQLAELKNKQFPELKKIVEEELKNSQSADLSALDDEMSRLSEGLRFVTDKQVGHHKIQIEKIQEETLSRKNVEIELRSQLAKLEEQLNLNKKFTIDSLKKFEQLIKPVETPTINQDDIFKLKDLINNFKVEVYTKFSNIDEKYDLLNELKIQLEILGKKIKDLEASRRKNTPISIANIQDKQPEVIDIPSEWMTKIEIAIENVKKEITNLKNTEFKKEWISKIENSIENINSQIINHQHKNITEDVEILRDTISNYQKETIIKLNELDKKEWKTKIENSIENLNNQICNLQPKNMTEDIALLKESISKYQNEANIKLKELDENQISLKKDINVLKADTKSNSEKITELESQFKPIPDNLKELELLIKKKPPKTAENHQPPTDLSEEWKVKVEKNLEENQKKIEGNKKLISTHEQKISELKEAINAETKLREEEIENLKLIKPEEQRKSNSAKEGLKKLANALQGSKNVLAMKMMHEEKQRKEAIEFIQTQIDELEKEVDILKKKKAEDEAIEEEEEEEDEEDEKEDEEKG